METANSQNTAPLKAEIQKKGLIHKVKLEYLRVYAHDGLQPDNAILCHLVKAAVYISLEFFRAKSDTPTSSYIICSTGLWNHTLQVLFIVQSRSKSTTLLVYVTCFLWLIYVMATRTHRSSWHRLLCVCENVLHENCTSKSDETSIKFTLTVRVVAVFLHRIQQLKADSQTKEPKQEAEEVSKSLQQIHDFHDTGYDNGYKEI